jgi:sulfide dehydrogenase cytochrome subunit
MRNQREKGIILIQNSLEKPMPKNMRSFLTTIGGLILALCFLTSAANASLAENAAQCDGCHGKDGASQESDVPIIGGVSSFVLEEYMFQYADAARPCRESKYRYGDTSRPATDMCVVAKNLSEEEITELAAYYADLNFVAAQQEFDAALAAQGASIHKRDCEKCHTDGGSYKDDDAGRLAGQWAPYLQESLADYASGERPMMEEKMQQKLENLNAEEIAALIQYYASLK